MGAPDNSSPDAIGPKMVSSSDLALEARLASADGRCGLLSGAAGILEPDVCGRLLARVSCGMSVCGSIWA